MATGTEATDGVDNRGGEYILASAALLLGAVMFGRVMRPILTFAAGMTAARGLWATDVSDAIRKPRGAREWVSDHKPGPSGYLSHNQKTDLAMEDSFPASDPPSSY